MRMNRIILASHGGLSAGMKDTVQMILGELPNFMPLLPCGMRPSLSRWRHVGCWMALQQRMLCTS